MIAVLIDSGSKTINECLGVSSRLELPLFTESFGNRLLKSISMFDPEKLYVVSKELDGLKNDFEFQTEFVKSLSDIQCVFLKNLNDFTAIFFSNVYFEVQENPTKQNFKSLLDFKLVSSVNDDTVGFVVSNRNLYEFLNGTTDISVLGSKITETIKVECYSKEINLPVDYKNLLADVLNGKASFRLPEVAQGVYAESKIPQGDFVIIPPVFFDEDVQIESGCVIGPSTAIMKNCLIAKNSNVRNSIISKNSYISSGCFIDGVMCSENVSVRRNSIVLSDAVLGYESSLGEDSVIENGSYIRPFSRIDDFKKNYINFKQESNQSPAGFYGYTPEKSALLGAAIGVVFNAPKIAVASDGEMNSTALKLGLLGGLVTTGAACYDFGNTFLSSLHYFMSFCELDCAVYISGNSEGTAITVFSKNTYSLSNGDYYNIKNVMTSTEIKRCDSEECKKIRQIHGMQRMYIQNLIKKFDCELDFMPVFQCDNKRILSTIEIALAKIGYQTGKKRVLFIINHEGTKLTAEFNGIYFSHGKLNEIVSHFNSGKGEIYFKDVNKSPKELWKLDAVILCFYVIEILQKNNITLDEAYKMLPDFYVAESTVSSNASLSSLASELSSNNVINFDRGEFRYQDGSSRVCINKANDGSFKIAARAVSVEAAQEIVGNIVEILRRY